LARRAIAVGVVAFFVWISAAPLAEASDARHLCGGLSNSRTNLGGKYTLDYGSQFHTNPGGKYVYQGQGKTFHTNPGGKYVYRNYSAAPR
jgi:hypothetical protein